MKNALLVNLTLILSGLIACAVGLGVLFAPHAFHASAGIVLGEDATLLNELRAPGGMLLAFGFFALAAVFRPGLAGPALILSVALYLSFALSRTVGLLLDGAPSDAMLQIIGAEYAVAALSAIALAARRGGAVQCARAC